MANLIPYPYYNSTKEVSGILYDLLPGGEIVVNGKATGMARFYIAYSYDVDLPAGTYTIRGTGVTGSSYYLYIRRKSTHTYLTSYTVTWDRTFTLSEDCEAMLYIVVNPGTTMHGVVLQPQIVSGSTLPDWEPYVETTTIDAENAKQIRRSMDVLIQVTPETGDPIVITNENLISCIVSLRSDLSILEPTLPESEINIEAYMDEDISETLAAIPDETPITYQAGYDDDLSPVRRFYLAEQITWVDNVMTIHGVDAVHKLDKEIGTALYATSIGPGSIANTAMGLIEDRLGVTFDVGNPYLQPTTTQTKFVVDDGPTIRDFIAKIHEYMHQEDNIWYTYVDAGIPSFSWIKPQTKWSINEEDCGEVQRNTDRMIANINLQQMTIRQMYGPNAGTATIVNNVGTSLSFDSSYVRSVAVGVGLNSRDSDLLAAKYSSADYDLGVLPLVPVTDSGKSSATFELPVVYHDRYQGLRRMLKDGIPQSEFKQIGNPGSTQPKVFTQFIPWAATYDTSDSYWTDNPGTTDIRSMSTARSVLVNAKIIESSTSDAEVAIGGSYYEMTADPVTYSNGATGVDIDIDTPAWFGSIESQAYGENFPAGAFNSILSRSPVTGSFIWKGDPRMQPRDVVTFHRLDGTDELITLENITITHEGGGTSAEITYRKGIC